MSKAARLDQEMVRRGLAATRAEAQAAIQSGHVLVRGLPGARAATRVSTTDPIVIEGTPPRYVSRGGQKLEGALAHFSIDVAGRRWLDAGASTGGFTDCLLQHGAAQVIAADVGYGQLAWRLRQDHRVHVMERCNLRLLTPDDLPWSPEGVVADLSFISLSLVLPALARVVGDDGEHEGLWLCLVKPQFELEPGAVGRGGVVRSPELWSRALRRVVGAAHGLGLRARGACLAHPAGPAGNREFFVYLARGGEAPGDHIERVVMEAAAEEGLA